MDFNTLLENALINSAFTENNRVRLKYYDQRDGKFKSPHKLIQEEKELFKPCVVGLFIKEDFVFSVEPKFEREPTVKATYTEKGIFNKQISMIGELSYSDVRHFGKICSPFMQTSEFELTPQSYKNIVEFYKMNWEDIKSERFIIDDLNEDEELQRLKNLFNN